ncbi:MAG: hypothetical protein WCJ30_03830, partial [Deltaproteobacteria bacterium]
MNRSVGYGSMPCASWKIGRNGARTTGGGAPLPEEVSVAPIVDASASITGAERAGVQALLANLRAPTTPTGRREVTFVDVPPSPRNPERTDLAPEVLLATALMPPGRLRRVLLATDGRDQGGALLQAVAA